MGAKDFILLIYPAILIDDSLYPSFRALPMAGWLFYLPPDAWRVFPFCVRSKILYYEALDSVFYSISLNIVSLHFTLLQVLIHTT